MDEEKGGGDCTAGGEKPGQFCRPVVELRSTEGGAGSTDSSGSDKADLQRQLDAEKAAAEKATADLKAADKKNAELQQELNLSEVFTRVWKSVDENKESRKRIAPHEREQQLAKLKKRIAAQMLPHLD